MIRRAFCICAVGVALVMAVVPATPEPTPIVPAALAAPVQLTGGSLVCDTDCSACEGDTHFAVGVEPAEANASRNEGWHNWPDCRTGKCKDTHGGCIIEFAAGPFETLLRSLRSNDVRAVRTVLVAHSDRVSLNVSRSAIQVEDCTGSGEIWAHLPLPPEMLESLLASNAE